MLSVLTHDLPLVPRSNGTERTGMSCPQTAKDLATALSTEYSGYGGAKRLAADMNCSVGTAKNILAGAIPESVVRFVVFFRKRPAVLTRALKTTWAEELQVRSEIAATRRRLDEMERRFEKAKTLDRTTA